MALQHSNTQLFALAHPPHEHMTVLGCRYRLANVFKHDFFAATALYQAAEPSARYPRLVVKAGRNQMFCGLPMDWIGSWLRWREQRAHRRLDGVPGVQKWVAQLSDTAYALEYIEGRTLDHLEGPPPAGFFESLRELLDAIHARGAAYCDLNKRSNILLQENGRPALIDFQVSVVGPPPRKGWLRWLLAPMDFLYRRHVAYLQRMDLYHLYKHKRRLVPQEMTDEEMRLGRDRGRLVEWHRKLVTPLRQWRRGFLTRQHKSGRLVSPSAHLENHAQPEKGTWRHDD